MKKLNFNLLLVIFSIFILSGCGGGGGGDSVSINPANNPVTNNPVTEAANQMKDTIITGQIVDPVVANGKVTIKDPMGHTLGFGFTDKNGHYSINIGHYEGPIQVELVCGENSKMTVNGMEMKCPAGDVFKAAETVAESGKEMIVNMSPLSDMANSLAGGFGMLNSKSIKKAKKAVFTIFGVDPTKDDPNSYAYSSALKALKEAAKRENISEKELLDNIKADIEQGYISKDSKASRSFLERVLVYAIYTALIDAINKNHVFDVDVEEDTKTSIDKAKKMVEELKEESYILIDPKDPNYEGELKKELDLLQDRVDNILIPYSKNAIKSAVEIAKLIEKTDQNGTDSNSITNTLYTLSVKKTDQKENYSEWNYKIEKDGEIFEGKVSKADNLEKGSSYSIEGKIPSATNEALDTKKYQNIKADIEIKDSNESETLANLTARTTALFEKDTPSLDLKIDSSEIKILKEKESYIIEPSKLSIDSKIEEFDIKGDIDLSNYVKNQTFKHNNHYLPAKGVFNGTIKNRDTLTQFDGKIELSLKDPQTTDLSNVSKTNPPPYILKISGDFTDYRFIKRAVWAYVEYLDNKTVKTEGESSRDDILIKFEGKVGVDYKTQKIKSFDLQFTNKDLVKLKMRVNENKEVSGEIISDGKKVGVIKNIDQIPFIKYEDGTLQSLI